MIELNSLHRAMNEGNRNTDIAFGPNWAKAAKDFINKKLEDNEFCFNYKGYKITWRELYPGAGKKYVASYWEAIGEESWLYVPCPGKLVDVTKYQRANLKFKPKKDRIYFREYLNSPDLDFLNRVVKLQLAGLEKLINAIDVRTKDE